MVSYIKIEEYVTLCRRALKKETPLEQIKALTNAKKIMCIDLMNEWTNRGVSNNWVQWWWNAVDALNLDFTSMQAAMGWSKGVGFENFIEWVDFVDNSETMYHGLIHDIGPGREYGFMDFDGSTEKHISNPEIYNDLNKRFPLLPTESSPSVTTLDLVFCELLLVWARTIWRLSRQAMVDGQVKKPQDALPREEYMGDNFIKYFIAAPQRTKKISAFKKAVQETNEELFPDVDYDPVQGLDEDFYPDYENDDNYKKVDSPPEEVETIVIHEFDARKVTPLSELPAKLEFYFNTAWKILGINDDGKKYQALGKLYDDIDKENGGYIDGAPQLPSDDIESCILAEKLRLIEPSGKRRETDVLKDYLQRVEKLISEGDDVTNIGGEVTIIDGWDWNPVEGKYPALVILEWLMIKIRKEMRNLHRQASYVEDIPKHKFIVHGHWDFIVNDDDTADWVYIEEQKYVTDDDLDPSPLPKWITGKSGSEESVSNVDNIEVPVTPSKEVKSNNTPDKTEENDLPVISETLTSKYNGQKILKVYKNLTDKEYLFCTEDAWLYVWGVKVHPTKKTEIKAPTELPRWSAMQGKKTAIGDMIRTLMATDCGKPWKKTAKLFLFSDGSQPVESNLKSCGLQGPSKTEFLKLVIVH